jgi:hypothetical protein
MSLDSAKLQELSELLSSLSAVNNSQSRLHLSEAIICDSNKQPVAKVTSDQHGTLALTELLAPSLDV